MIHDILHLSEAIRYVALYQNNQLTSQSKQDTAQASSHESDKYEELIVNPTLLMAASQRGNIDCGGLDYLLIKYGNFFQLVFAIQQGHLSICIEPNDDPIAIEQLVKNYLKQHQAALLL